MNTQINNTKETEVKYTFPELDEMTKESQDHINKMETKLNCNLGILVK